MDSVISLPGKGGFLIRIGAAVTSLGKIWKFLGVERYCSMNR